MQDMYWNLIHVYNHPQQFWNAVNFTFKGFKVQQNLAYFESTWSLNHLKNNVWPCYQYLQFLVIKVNFHYVTGPCGFQHTIALICKARCTLHLTKNISWSFWYCMHWYFCVYVDGLLCKYTCSISRIYN